MYLIRIESIFDCGHRLLDYVGKCAYPHGHTYGAEIFLRGDTLNRLGLMFDFTELKRRVNPVDRRPLGPRLSGEQP